MKIRTFAERVGATHPEIYNQTPRYLFRVAIKPADAPIDFYSPSSFSILLSTMSTAPKMKYGALACGTAMVILNINHQFASEIRGSKSPRSSWVACLTDTQTGMAPGSCQRRKGSSISRLRKHCDSASQPPLLTTEDIFQLRPRDQRIRHCQYVFERTE